MSAVFPQGCGRLVGARVAQLMREAVAERGLSVRDIARDGSPRAARWARAWLQQGADPTASDLFQVALLVEIPLSEFFERAERDVAEQAVTVQN